MACSSHGRAEMSAAIIPQLTTKEQIQGVTATISLPHPRPAAAALPAKKQAWMWTRARVWRAQTGL